MYPEDLRQKDWFRHYSELFSTVEVNNTFYRLPAAQTFEKWCAQAPPGFIYAVKLNRYGTHRRRLRQAEEWLPNELARVVALGPSLGPLLAQLPPRWKADPLRLADFCAQTRQTERDLCLSQPLRLAVEFRDSSWLQDKVLDVLACHQMALCVHDMLEDHPWEATTNWVYARFHGPRAGTDKYAGEYGAKGLESRASQLLGWEGSGKDVYAYFNNDRGGAAVRDATWLAQRLVG